MPALHPIKGGGRPARTHSLNPADGRRRFSRSALSRNEGVRLVSCVLSGGVFLGGDILGVGWVGRGGSGRKDHPCSIGVYIYIYIYPNTKLDFRSEG